MKKKRILVSFLIILLAFVSISVLNKHKSFITPKKVNAQVINQTNNEDVTEDIVDIKELKSEYNNDEVVGFLRIPNTNIEAVITQANNNKKYLTNDAYGNRTSIGNPFLDYRVDINKSDKLLIYGHNSKRKDTPLKNLEKYYDKDYYLDHQDIELITEQNIFKYKIFSVYVETQNWDYMKIDFKDSDEWLNHIEKLKSRSLYETDVGVNEKDDILILQTCSYKKEYENYNKKYLLVVARRVNQI